MFVDKVLVKVIAGNGGNGVVSWRKEKFIDRGGPDGGDGGRGGDVIFVADPNENTLVSFRFKQELKAQNGVNGAHRNQHGRNGDDLFVKVPVGTQVWQDDKIIADLVANGQQVVIAKGGDGGFGNAHFKSSVRRAPKVAEVGEQGEEKDLTLELKILADVGLLGFPNAGKSTFLSVISNAKPEIGDYAFTTLTPNLGVAVIDNSSLLVADIPGLIEGASQGKGLGDAFLRHVERTEVLIHLIDIYEDDVAKAYQTINAELVAYNKQMSKRPQIVALTKIEGLPQDGIDQKIAELKKVVPKGTQIFAISSQAHIGVTELLRAAQKLVTKVKSKAAKNPAKTDELPTISLGEQQKENAWKVTKKEGYFVVVGNKIEKFAARTNFDTEPGLRRLRDIMKKMGIMHELERQGVKHGDKIVIGRRTDYSLTF
ncbi:MAG TPA: GTPase ObgE [Candidatus Saccharimonadales bacterium]|nr:GTPase ObgE [Candidatus Saccharimonadales bacterium]